MFNIGPAEMMVILVIALLVLGPTKLPDAARQVGRALGELRRMSSGFQAEMRDALKEPVEGKPSSPGTAKAPSQNGALSSPRPPAGDVATAAEPAVPAQSDLVAAEATVEGEAPGGADSGEGPTEPDGAAAEAGSNGTTPT